MQVLELGCHLNGQRISQRLKDAAGRSALQAHVRTWGAGRKNASKHGPDLRLMPTLHRQFLVALHATILGSDNSSA